MEIRKADAKGRVTGFIPGEVYFVSRESGRSVVVAPLSTRPSFRQTVEELRKGKQQHDEELEA